MGITQENTGRRPPAYPERNSRDSGAGAHRGRLTTQESTVIKRPVQNPLDRSQ